MILPALAALLPACAAIALLAAFLGGRVGAFGTAGCAVAGLALAVAAILKDGRTLLALPFGPGEIVLALDPLTAFFILPVCTTALACGLCHRAATLTPALLGAMLLVLLAGDGLSLVLGFELTSLACWGLRAGTRTRGVTASIFGGACVLAAVALLAPAGDWRFAAIRATPPEAVRAGLALLLILMGVAAKAPFRAIWPPHAAPLVVTGLTLVGAYAVLRVAFDLAGAAVAPWWCAPALLLGAAAAVAGALRSNRAATLRGVLTATAAAQAGLIAIGIGVALAARAADLAPLEALASQAVLLHALNLGAFQTLGLLCAAAAEHGAGSGTLDRLGGLAHAMPVTAGGMLVATASLAALPPSAGFASVWLLVQAVIAGGRIGGLGLQCLLAVVAAALALATALTAAAGLRLVGIAFLGRPRTPRAAAAEEASPLIRRTLAGLALVAVLLGLFPGMALRLMPEMAAPSLAPGAGAAWLGLGGQPDAAGYLPLALLGLLAAALAAMRLAGRQLRLARPRPAVAWTDGAAPPPAWLPFGDPATQITAAALAAPGVMGRPWDVPAGLLRPLIRARRQVLATAARFDGVPAQASLAAMAILLALLCVWATA